MASHTLLNLVTRLQQVMSVAQGRAMLLDYARKSCGARLALLFLLDQERQVLKLVEHSGRHPHPSEFAPEHSPVEVPVQGLFGSALQQPGFIDVPDISLNPLSLPEEHALSWPHSRVLLHALRQVQLQGVLVFCFTPSGSRIVPNAQSEEELLICVSLLSAYLGKEDELAFIRRDEDTLYKPDKRSPRRTSIKNEQEQAESLFAPLSFGDMLRSWQALWTLGLTPDVQLEKQEFSAQILRVLVSTFHATSGCLWRYQTAQEVFQLQYSSAIAEDKLLIERATAELNSLTRHLLAAGNEPSYGLFTLDEKNERTLVWHTLRYHEQLSGVLGLVLPQQTGLSPEQRLWISLTCELVALLLLHYDRHESEQEELLEQERNRIAREMHDSVVQDIAHVSQKLDYIQRVLEKQPQVALSEVEQARKLLNRSLRDLRYGISSLLPLSLEGQDFEEALNVLISEYSQSAPHLAITCDMDRVAVWPHVLRAPIYRFMQEALNNIRKHASASEVNIRIRHLAGLGVVQIADNGRGFVPERMRGSLHNAQSLPRRLGLLTMEERIRQAGGVLEIRSKPGEGTTLKARFPLAQASTILTEREREVLRLLVEGLTNRAISERLSVSLETVKSHVHHIMQKMHVKDRTQAAVVATRQQWL